uniref:Uncharacterized protein n=1 Tax=Romanomermis culicivorax TaxID=13658 RepID=A0A915HDE0_ROMCU
MVGFIISILEFCLALVVVAHLLMATIMDPGSLPKGEEKFLTCLLTSDSYSPRSAEPNDIKHEV